MIGVVCQKLVEALEPTQYCTVCVLGKRGGGDGCRRTGQSGGEGIK